MSTLLARMATGFADPVHGAQQTFRVLLGAMSEPGRLFTLHDAAIDGLETQDATLMRDVIAPLTEETAKRRADAVALTASSRVSFDTLASEISQ